MADKCGDCLNIEWDNKERWSSIDRYWCREKRRYVEPTDHKCSDRYFLEDKSKSADGGYTPSGCYITTIVVDVLGYDDDCELLTVLRNFRDTTLKSNPEYLPLLFEYDRVGPIISSYINMENNNYRFCLGLLEHFLIPCTIAIKKGNVDEAIIIYKNMVMHLNDEFSLPDIQISVPKEYDLETLGKGRVRCPKTSEI